MELIQALDRPAPVLARWRQERNENPPPPRILPNRAELLQVAVEELRENHDCDHTQTWRYRDGGGHCVGCHDYLDRYVYVSFI